MTRAFVDYAHDVHAGALEPAKIDAGIIRELPRQEPLALIQGFVAGNPEAFLRALPPTSPEYAMLVNCQGVAGAGDRVGRLGAGSRCGRAGARGERSRRGGAARPACGHGSDAGVGLGRI